MKIFSCILSVLIFLEIFFQIEEMATPQKYQFANYLGFKRQDAVFSNIDARHVDQSSGLFASFNVQYAKLKLYEDITKPSQKGLTTTLMEVDSEATFTIPKGSCILDIAVCDNRY